MSVPGRLLTIPLLASKPLRGAELLNVTQRERRRCPLMSRKRR